MLRAYSLWFLSHKENEAGMESMFEPHACLLKNVIDFSVWQGQMIISTGQCSAAARAQKYVSVLEALARFRKLLRVCAYHVF